MNNSVAQHPELWLLLAFLLGLCAEWLLEIFFLRKPLADARAAARRRGEEFDSERFAHGRTQTEFKAKLAELDTVQKGRTLAESLLAAARTKLSATEAQAAEAGAAREALTGELAAVHRRNGDAEAERASLQVEVLDLRLRLAEHTASLATESNAAAELRAYLTKVQAAYDEAVGSLPALEAEASAQSTKAQALEADLQASMRRHADTESSLAEVRGALAAAQDELAAARKARTRSEGDLATLTAKLQKLEQSALDAKSGAGATDQKLKARIEEVKQLSAQLGEATEELSAVKAKAAQLEANLTAAQATRKTLEKELAGSAVPAAAPTPETVSAELAGLREQLQESERSTGSWRTKAQELEAELLATSRAHQALEAELERLRSASPGPPVDESLAADLETMTRERNELAAELAGIRSRRKR